MAVNSFTNMGEVGVLALLCILLLLQERVGEAALDSYGPRYWDLQEGDRICSLLLPSSELLDPLFFALTDSNTGFGS